MTIRFFRPIVIVSAVVFCLALISQLILPIRQVSAADTIGFNPGNIISDYIFTENSSMSVADIQNFFVSKGSTCLVNFKTLSLNDVNNDGLGDEPYGKGVGEQVSAATLIWQAAQLFRINPKVILATLQKENGLITRSDCPDWRYNTALGFGCPDNQPCDVAAYGFTRQIDYGTWHLRGFFDDTYPSPRTTPGNRLIAYNPDDACGGTTINIENRATASLYSYTPYQPNTATLAAAPGQEVWCGAYGNLNFWRYFTDWFGSTHRDSPLVSSADGGVYLLENGTKRAFPTMPIFLSYSYSWNDITIMSDAALVAIPNGPNMNHFREGQLVKTAGSGVYLIENATKRAFPSGLIFLSYSYKWSDVRTISSVELSLLFHISNGIPDIPDGPIMTYNRNGQLISSTDGGGVYLVESGKKRPFPNGTIFLSYSYKWSMITNITDAELALTPDGEVMPYNAHFRDGQLVMASGGVYLVESGKKRPFPNGTIFLSYSYKWSMITNITDAELAIILDGAPMTMKTL